MNPIIQYIEERIETLEKYTWDSTIINSVIRELQAVLNKIKEYAK